MFKFQIKMLMSKWKWKTQHFCSRCWLSSWEILQSNSQSHHRCRSIAHSIRHSNFAPLPVAPWRKKKVFPGNARV